MGILQKIHIFIHNGSRLIYEKTTYFVFINLYFRPTDKRKTPTFREGLLDASLFSSLFCLGNGEVADFFQSGGQQFHFLVGEGIGSGVHQLLVVFHMAGAGFLTGA